MKRLTLKNAFGSLLKEQQETPTTSKYESLEELVNDFLGELQLSSLLTPSKSEREYELLYKILKKWAKEAERFGYTKGHDKAWDEAEQEHLENLKRRASEMGYEDE